MAAIVPSSQQPISGPGGFITTYWQRFFASLVAPPAAIGTVTVGSSPFLYTAPSAGTVSVTGGTVTDISLTRNTSTIPTGLTAGLIPVSNGDVVTVTYAVLPDISFVPG